MRDVYVYYATYFRPSAPQDLPVGPRNILLLFRNKFAIALDLNVKNA